MLYFSGGDPAGTEAHSVHTSLTSDAVVCTGHGLCVEDVKHSVLRKTAPAGQRE